MTRTLLVAVYVANADHEAKDPDDLVAAAAPCIRWTLTEAGWRVA